MDTTMREEGKFFFRWLLNVGRHSSGWGASHVSSSPPPHVSPKKELNIVILLFPPKKYRKHIFFGQGPFPREAKPWGGSLEAFFGEGKKRLLLSLQQAGPPPPLVPS